MSESMKAIQRPSAFTPNQRRCQYLRKWRLFLGLCLGPIVCAALVYAIQLLVGDEEPSNALLGMLVFGTAWHQLVGWAYLLLIARNRGRISRRESLLIGVVAMEFLPLVVYLIIFGLAGHAGTQEAFAGFGFGWVVLSLVVFLVFGLISGWLFWRLGVRPAKTPELAEARVFD